MAKICAVYNTCGISGKDNTDYYIKAIDTILNQTKKVDLIISDCKGLTSSRDKLKQINVPKLFIDDVLPVNITFNYAIQKMIELNGEYDWYLYLDSGIQFTNNNQIEQLETLLDLNQYAMVAAQVDNDSGYSGWFGTEHLPPYDFIVPVGRTCHLHCQFFSNDLYQFYGNILPDIFASYCTESVFTFMCAAIKKHFVISSNIKVHHAFGTDDGLDGHSSGFRAPHGTWDHTFKTNKSMVDICNSYIGQMSGFGYEEIRGILPHNPNCYNNGICTNEILKWFIKDNLYLKRYEFNYKEIQHQFYA